MSIEKSNMENTNEKCEIQEEKTREFLAKEYDSKNKEHNKYENKENYVEAKYKEYHRDEIKNMFQEDEIEIKKARIEIKELSEELEDSNSMTETQIEDRKREVRKWKEKWRRDRIDQVTGLEIRKVLFERMNEKIKEIYAFDEETTRKDIFETFVKKSPSDFGKKDFSVILADVSFLSLVNEAGHKQGDMLLKQIGAEVKKEVANSYRHGGDEITGFFDEENSTFNVDNSDFQKKISKMQESIRRLPIEKISEYQLKPNLDVGIASFDEALIVFRDLAKNSEVNEKLKVDPIKKIENIMVAIADKRSFIEKGKERISLLAEKYDNRKVYDQIISYLRKGGHGISDKKVKEIADIAKGTILKRIMNFFKQLTGGEDLKTEGQDEWKANKSIRTAIAKFITEKEQVELTKLKKAEDKYPYYESRAIMKIIEI